MRLEVISPSPARGRHWSDGRWRDGMNQVYPLAASSATEQSEMEAPLLTPGREGFRKGDPPVFHLNAEAIKQADSLIYLGSIFTKKHNIDEEIVAWINQGSASFGRLRSRVFLNHHLKTEAKVAVYRAVCMSTLLYGAESWAAYHRHVKQLEAFHIRCLQRILGLIWQDKVPHSEILHHSNLLSIESTLAE
ncbi:uncharacterized protein [Palaemon carinicauda]|uniref:uncharacterized protein n=1 Tax=Palaemon carinicauda TaxID=392227 RepID=UPI0035B64D37